MESLPGETQQQANSRGRGRRLFLLTSIGVVLIALAAGVAHYLYRTTDPSNFDPAPLPRPKLDAPFVTSPDPVVERMVEVAGITADDVVYDLGCGDGRIVITAALRRGCRGVGFDKKPERVQEAIENVKKHQVEHLVTIQQRDIFTVDLSEANVVLMYLLPWMMNELVPQFERMKSGSRIVSHDFDIQDIQPDDEVEVILSATKQRHVIYLWTTPLKRKAARPNNG